MEEYRNKRLYKISENKISQIETLPESRTIFKSERAQTEILYSESGDTTLIIAGEEYKGSFYLASELLEEWILPLLVEGYSPSLWNLSPIDSSYINERILPMYDNFDGAHQRDHAISVIDASLAAAKDLGVNPEICYIVAAFHDIGLTISREFHHIESARLFRENEYIKSLLSDQIINLIAQAIEDHRASSKNLPRSIFGIIVADSDRLLEPRTVVSRTIKFGIARYSSSFDMQLERCYDHISKKYSREGYLKYYIPTIQDINNREKLYKLAEDKKAFSKFFDEIYQEIVK